MPGDDEASVLNQMKAMEVGLMNATDSWIDEALQNLHLREDIIDDSRIDRFRLAVDRSGLPERMSATCRESNADPVFFCQEKGLL